MRCYGVGILIPISTLIFAVLFCSSNLSLLTIFSAALILCAVPIMTYFIFSIVSSSIMGRWIPSTCASLVGYVCAALFIGTDQFVSLINFLSLNNINNGDFLSHILNFIGELLTVASLIGATMLLFSASLCLVVEIVTARSSVNGLIPTRAFHSILILIFVGLSLQFIAGLFDGSVTEVLSSLRRA